MYVFFFSSRRRHTRWTGDWSSDVCSSDLAQAGERAAVVVRGRRERVQDLAEPVRAGVRDAGAPRGEQHGDRGAEEHRSEERRVGKEGRAWWRRYDETHESEQARRVPHNTR